MMFKALFSTLAVAVAVGPAHAIGKLNITAEEHLACDGDAERLCMSAYPDEMKLLACMKANRLQLTPVCLTAFDAGMKRRHLL